MTEKANSSRGKKLGENFLLSKFISNNFLILILINSGNVFNYLFYFLLGRILSPDDYGTFNALNSLVVFLVAPMIVVQLVVARFSTLLGDQALAAFARKFSKWLFFIVLAVIIVGILSTPAIGSFLNVTKQFPLVVMVMILGVTILLSIPLGLLQGLRRFKPYGILNLCLSSIRFFLAVLLVWYFGFGINGAVSSVFFCVCITLIIGYYYLKDVIILPGGRVPEELPGNIFKYAIPTLLSTATIMGFLNLDIVLVRHYCDPAESGMYSAAAVIGHIAYLLPSVIVTVMFPEVAHSQNKGESSRKVFMVSFVMTALLSGAVTFVCTVFPEIVMSLTYGEKYGDSSGLLPIISFAMTALVLANVFVTYGMAQNDFKFLWGLGAGMILFFLQVFYRHDEPIQIAWALLYSSLFLLISGIIWRLPQMLSVLKSSLNFR